jgi:hypothetical protein
LCEAGLLHENKIKYKLEKLSLTVKTFWTCFKEAIDNNPTDDNGKIRILSVIADDFKYDQIHQELNVIMSILFFNLIQILINTFIPFFYSLIDNNLFN